MLETVAGTFKLHLEYKINLEHFIENQPSCLSWNLLELKKYANYTQMAFYYFISSTYDCSGRIYMIDERKY